MSTRKHIRAAVVMAAIGVLLVACSSSKNDTGATTSAAGSASGGGSTAATGSPVSIVYIASFPQPGQPAQPEIEASMRARVAALNAAGGIGGHPVKLIACYDQGDANQSRSCANDAVSNSNVVASIFTYSNNGDIINSIFTQAGLPQIGLDPQGDDLKCTTCFAFWGGGITDSVGEPALLYTYDHIDNVGIMCPTVPVCPTEVGYGKDSFLKLVPNGTVKTQFVAFNTADLSPNVQTFKSVDGVALLTGGSQLVSWIKTAKSLGLDKKYAILGTILTPTLLQQGGSLFEGALVALDTAPSDSDVPGAKAYRADIAKYAPSGTPIDQNAMYGWMGVKAFGDVASTIKGDITRSSVLAAMNGLRDYTGLGGLIPAYSTDNNFTGLNGDAPRLFNPTLFPAKIENGKVVPLGKDFYNPFTGKTVAAP